MTDTQYVQVQNLTDYSVVYVIPEDNIRRVFGANEEKRIAYTELQKLFYQPGGATLIKEFLSIKDKNIAQEFGVSEDSFEHEYSWTTEDVDKLLRSGSLDALHDALDFAPEGIVDMIVSRAVALRIPDVNKRQLIQECTGRNIDQMIRIQINLEQQLGEKQEEKTRSRRVETKTTPAQGSRRAE